MNSGPPPIDWRDKPGNFMSDYPYGLARQQYQFFRQIVKLVHDDKGALGSEFCDDMARAILNYDPARDQMIATYQRMAEECARLHVRPLYVKRGEMVLPEKPAAGKSRRRFYWIRYGVAGLFWMMLGWLVFGKLLHL